jgi:galactokinase
MATQLQSAAFAQKFQAFYGARPRLFAAPGRVNLIGDHTDHAGGLVMPGAIDRALLVAAAPNGLNTLRLRSLQQETVVEAALPALSPRGDWSDYVCGVAAVLMRRGVAVPGVDLLIDSDVPPGAGVSSSAALEAGAALAFLAMADVSLAPMAIAQACQEAENSFVGMPCGLMDQFASVFGQRDRLLLFDCTSLAYQALPFPTELRLLLIESGVTHTHVDSGYAQRRREADAAVARLRGEAVDSAIPDAVIDKRLAHITGENDRVRTMGALLEGKADGPAIGALVNASHASLRDLFESSHPHVDALQAIAAATPGVYGARIMGGGFGGSVIAVVGQAHASDAASAIEAAYRDSHGVSAGMHIVSLSDGAREIAS